MKLIKTSEELEEYINADYVSYVYQNPSSGDYWAFLAGGEEALELSEKAFNEILTYGKI